MIIITKQTSKGEIKIEKRTANLIAYLNGEKVANGISAAPIPTTWADKVPAGITHLFGGKVGLTEEEAQIVNSALDHSMSEKDIESSKIYDMECKVLRLQDQGRHVESIKLHAKAQALRDAWNRKYM